MFYAVGYPPSEAESYAQFHPQDEAEYLQYCHNHEIDFRVAEEYGSYEEVDGQSAVHEVTQQLQAWALPSGGAHARGLCPDYSRTGKCSRGASCPWIHGNFCQARATSIP